LENRPDSIQKEDMLNWSSLSQTQRLLSSFFCLVAALFVLAPLFARPFAVSGALSGAAIGLGMLAVLLNPAWLRGNREAFSWSKQPGICRTLFTVATLVFVVRSVVALSSW
jgi:hypothetical protein